MPFGWYTYWRVAWHNDGQRCHNVDMVCWCCKSWNIVFCHLVELPNDHNCYIANVRCNMEQQQKYHMNTLNQGSNGNHSIWLDIVCIWWNNSIPQDNSCTPHSCIEHVHQRALVQLICYVVLVIGKMSHPLKGNDQILSLYPDITHMRFWNYKIN